MKRGDENELERNLRLEKVVASKQPKFSVETDVERRARLENMLATTQLRLAMETEEERSAKKGMNLIGRAKQALGCSIEISRDIYMSAVCMSTVCQINCVGGIT